jgi:uncharacterized protein (DUF169 family)
MSDLSAVSRDLVQSLELKHQPVGVTIFLEGEPLPPGLEFSQEKLKSYCQGLVLAGAGKTMLLKGEQMGCKLGTSVLGFEKDREGHLDDGVLEKYGVGLYGTEEAAAATILQSTYLEKGKSAAALIAPLSAFKELPQVVVFTANSEQVMWLLYAVNYDKGGKMDLPQSGGALGGCADVTALPMMKDVPDVSFMGLGCRLKSGLDACHLMLGTPGDTITMIHTHILDLAKPIAMLRKAQAGGA